MAKLVFFIGPAGAGKTTLAKSLAASSSAVFLDMDTLLQPAASAVMLAAGLDPEDRDSPEYKRLCRDLGYRITMDAALENLQLGSEVYVIGPFTKELSDRYWLERELEKAGLEDELKNCRAVYVYLENEQLYRTRIEQRGLPLDRWKLENWNLYRQTLIPKKVEWNLPESHILHLDNAGPLTQEKLERLKAFIR
ncbi:AAA family ATPase [Paenibacillus tarimensis]|uniref:AAA family ATPase n=1 Tax=Paenibacillus tarimensis TaxID=416012 RepID=UPI001F27B4F9|nr:AAA family ATPase [Paenibacillus tarimensis]MCF2944613.1 ATP-binding protein [Paenibacillus tarimensis]